MTLEPQDDDDVRITLLKEEIGALKEKLHFERVKNVELNHALEDITLDLSLMEVRIAELTSELQRYQDGPRPEPRRT